MKKLLLICALIGIFLLNGCSCETEKAEETSEPLIEFNGPTSLPSSVGPTQPPPNS